MEAIERIQQWYADQCNGDWEHSWGIKITALDNPGWMIDINLTDTKLEEKLYNPVKIERTERDWVVAVIKNKQFQLRCGPLNLNEALTIFCDWAGVN